MPPPNAQADTPPPDDDAVLPPSSDLFAPTWGRAAFGLGLAAAAFFLPQEVPLEYYPLNEPGNDILYWEISFASTDFTGNTFLRYDVGKGFNDLHSIQIPIAPTERTYTYTFPLLDAPITALRMDPADKQGEIRIRQMRIIDRRETEIRRFTKDDMMPASGIASIFPLEEGWKIVTAADAHDPYLRIRLDAPLVAHGLNHRNFLRSLYSWSYLALMLWIILLAVYFTFLRHRDWRTLAKSVSFLALLALAFSAVGNRGLIRNSWAYSRFEAPAVAPGGLRLEFDLATDRPVSSQLFLDVGAGIRGEDSQRRDFEPHPFMQTLRFDLPHTGELREIRWDPVDAAATFRIYGIRVVDRTGRTLTKLPPNALHPIQQVASLTEEDGALVLRTTENANDPIVIFTPEALAMIQAARQTHVDAAQRP